MDDQIFEKKLKTKPALSVIIPSYNGAHRIGHALKALTRQQIKDFEIIVVVDGSTDDTKRVLNDWKDLLNLVIKIQENKGRAVARNAGASLAQSDVLVFLDDDMRPEPNWIQEHLNHHQSHPDTSMVGSVKSDPLRSETDFHQYLAARSGQWMDNCTRAENPMTLDNLFFSSANCSMSKKTFEAVGGFDEQLSDAEDFDLGYRLLKSDVEVWFNARCQAWHDDFPDLRKYIHRQRQYRSAWFQLIELRPEILKDTRRFNPKPPRGLKGLFFKLFATKVWFAIARSAIFRILVPRKLRFKIYDYIIASLGRFNRHVNIQ